MRRRFIFFKTSRYKNPTKVGKNPYNRQDLTDETKTKIIEKLKNLGRIHLDNGTPVEQMFSDESLLWARARLTLMGRISNPETPSAEREYSRRLLEELERHMPDPRMLLEALQRERRIRAENRRREENRPPR